MEQRTPIVAAKETAPVAQMLRNLTKLGVVSSAAGTHRSRIQFSLDPSSKGGPEGYQLSVSPAMIRMTASTPAGLFYAMQTLRQLLPPEIESGKVAEKWTIPCVEISDSPKFLWRGMHLDVSRHFFSVSEIKRYIDYIAAMKMNVFHWHLVDDGGWRIESTKYPLLTKIGAWREPGEPWSQSKLRFPGGDTSKLYGGFYTKSEIRDIVKYASNRFVTVVPEIEMPGHTLPVIVAYPELACQGYDAESYFQRSGNYRANVYCAGNDRSFSFIDDLLAEVCELFPSKFIHVGGDEVDKFLWSNCASCRARMDRENLKDTHELQSYFIRRIEKLLDARGRRLIGWDEILEGGLAPKAAVMSWRGESGGITAANAGHEVVMSPTSPCYFDYSYADNSTRKVFEYSPIPKELTGAAQGRVLGAQANVWTEWMPTFTKVQQMIFPRILAMSEACWSQRANRSWEEFEVRLGQFFERLDVMKVAFTIPKPEVYETIMFYEGPFDLTLPSTNYSGLDLRYTLDGTAPKANSSRYSGKIRLEKPCVVRTAYVSKGGLVGDSVSIAIVPPNQTSQDDLIPGLIRSEFEGNWSRVPTFDSLKPARTSLSKTVDTSDLEGKDNYAVHFRGVLRVPSDGEYTFFLGSDDGSWLKLAGVMFIDNDGLHAFSFKQGRIKLKKGDYAFEVGFFEQGGADKLQLDVETAGIRRPVPSEWLFHSAISVATKR